MCRRVVKVLEQAPDERPVIVAGRLEAGDDRGAEAREDLDETVVLASRVEHGEAAPALTGGPRYAS
jgi:hypothetical protein